MPTLNLLYQRRYPINDHISIVIPSVGDVIDKEEEYYSLVTALTAMPIDLLVQLDDENIDFTTINEYELFLRLFPGIARQDTSLIFEDLDLSNFKYATNTQNGNIILLDEESGATIDRSIHGQISEVLRKIHHIKKDTRKPANEEARKYMIKRARDKMRRKRNQKQDSQLEHLIVAMVNTEQYKYDFEGTRELSIYQFNECVSQICKKIDYDHKMHGIYAGTISTKDLSQDDLNWLTHK